jgi:hypothetical protein
MQFTNISDSGMWAIAAMVVAPAAMAIGIAYFINQSQRWGWGPVRHHAGQDVSSSFSDVSQRGIQEMR